MDLFINIYGLIDKVLIPLYRFPENALVGYCLGTVVLAFAAVIVGECSILFAFQLNKERINRENQRISHFQELSFEALKAGDKTSFKACNGIANEAYGKNFFAQIALSAASLCPVFIALGWMQYRFAKVEFTLPFLGNTFSFGYVLTFIACYISARLLFGKIRKEMLRFKTKHLIKNTELCQIK